MSQAGITGLILAGGRGQRMGGQDKGLTIYRGEPLVQHVARRISPQVDRLIVSCNRNRRAYERLGFETVADDFPDYPGPLAGIAAGAHLISTPLLFCCPCDVPYVPDDVVQQLLAHMQTRRITYVQDGNRAQPLLCLIQREATQSILPYLEANGRSVMGWMDREQAVAVSWDGAERPEGAPDPFLNLNTPKDLHT